MRCGDCKPMPRYTRRLVVEKPRTTLDGAGQTDLTEDSNWVQTGTVRARFITRGGMESRVFDQIQAETTHVIETPATTFSRSIIPSWRAKFDGRKLNITAAYNVNEDRRGVVRLEAKEAV